MLAEDSIAGVMGARRYNRAVRLHKLVYDAFTRMAWKGFRSWLEATHAVDVVHMDETLRIIDNLCEDVSQASLKQVIVNSSCTCIMELFGVYIEFLRMLMWKWQYLDILVVVHGHDRDFAGTHPSIQRGRLDATPGIRTSHDSMVLRI